MTRVGSLKHQQAGGRDRMCDVSGPACAGAQRRAYKCFGVELRLFGE